MATFNSTVFFDSVRDDPFNGVLTQGQVNGMNFILQEWKRQFGVGGDFRHLAYMLATTFHETAYTMMPITEYGSQSYLQGKSYYPYIGRGFVQLTWDYNYERGGEVVDEDLLNYPDLALQPNIASAIMFDGMAVGWFTEHKLKDYFNEEINDAYNARRIINGTDRASDIKGYHEDFLVAIESAVT
jgi:predicted chitinase